MLSDPHRLTKKANQCSQPTSLRAEAAAVVGSVTHELNRTGLVGEHEPSVPRPLYPPRQAVLWQTLCHIPSPIALVFGGWCALSERVRQFWPSDVQFHFPSNFCPNKGLVPTSFRRGTAPAIFFRFSSVLSALYKS
jgi:hypothetical protein